jgi:hypothetical protein
VTGSSTIGIELPGRSAYPAREAYIRTLPENRSRAPKGLYDSARGFNAGNRSP